MPEPNKLEIYRLLYRLNRGFAFVVEQLKQLEHMRMIPPKDMRMFQASVQELQADINDLTLDELQSMEQRDVYEFGRIRTAREKELRDPNDVFLQAEERRKELKQKKQKTPHPKARG